MNSGHYEIICSGVAAWNLWRTGNQNVRPDLANADLSGRNLSGVDLSDAVATGANFRGAELITARFAEASVSGADFSHSTLNDADFTDAIAVSAVFCLAVAEGTNFRKANLRGARFNRARCSRSNFYFANLSAADLSRADFTSANLISAALSGTNLNWTALENAEFDNSDLRECLSRTKNYLLASYDKATLRRLRFSEDHRLNRDGDIKLGLPRLNFSAYDLSYLDLTANDLTRVNLAGSNLQWCILKSCLMEGCNLTEANCDFADFSGAVLSYSTLVKSTFFRANLSQAILFKANLQGCALVEANGLSAELLATANNHMLAIYDADFGERVLKLPSQHEELYLSQHLDPVSMGSALVGATLSGADFSGWTISRVNFQHADLTNAVLDQACAIQADFSHANLAHSSGTGGDFSDAQFSSAVLRNGRFAGSKGIRIAHLQGADIFGCDFPAAEEVRAAVAALVELSKHAWWCITGLVLFWSSSALLVLGASDRALVGPDGLFSFGFIPATINGRLFCTLIPLVVFVSFCYLHILLQSVWGEAAKLPTVLPSGEHAHKCINPWLLNGMVRSSMVLRGELAPRSRLQEALSLLVLYGLAPAVTALFWLSYVHCRDWAVMWLQCAVTIAGLTGAAAFHQHALATLTRSRVAGSKWKVVTMIRAVPKWARLQIGVVSALLIGFSAVAPYLRYERLVIRDEVISASQSMTPGKGRIANLAGRDLCYTDARRTQLVGANLSDAKLRFSSLTRANLDYAELQGADLRGADLTGATLRETNFQGADLRGTTGTQDLIRRGAILDRSTKLSR